jgi:hypothetical protein
MKEWMDGVENSDAQSRHADGFFDVFCGRFGLVVLLVRCCVDVDVGFFDFLNFFDNNMFVYFLGAESIRVQGRPIHHWKDLRVCCREKKEPRQKTP